MKRPFLLLILLAIFSAVLLWLDYSHPVAPVPISTAQSDNPAILAPVPDFSFTTLDSGAAHHIRDFQGRTVLINFWASWCLPCIKELPLLLDLARRRPNEMTVLLLSADEDRDAALEFMQDFSARMTEKQPNSDPTASQPATSQKELFFPGMPNVITAWDEGRHISQDLFQSIRYPESFIITPEGRIREKIIGVISEEKMEVLLESHPLAD